MEAAGVTSDMTFSSGDMEQLSTAFNTTQPPPPAATPQNVQHDIFQGSLEMASDYGSAALLQNLGNIGTNIDANVAASTTNLAQQMNYHQQAAPGFALTTSRTSRYPQLSTSSLEHGAFSSQSFSSSSLSSPSVSFAAPSSFTQSNTILTQQTLGSLVSQGLLQQAHALLQQQQIINSLTSQQIQQQQTRQQDGQQILGSLVSQQQRQQQPQQQKTQHILGFLASQQQQQQQAQQQKLQQIIGPVASQQQQQQQQAQPKTQQIVDSLAPQQQEQQAQQLKTQQIINSLISRQQQQQETLDSLTPQHQNLVPSILSQLANSTTEQLTTEGNFTGLDNSDISSGLGDINTNNSETLNRGNVHQESVQSLKRQYQASVTIRSDLRHINAQQMTTQVSTDEQSSLQLALTQQSESLGSVVTQHMNTQITSQMTSQVAESYTQSSLYTSHQSLPSTVLPNISNMMTTADLHVQPSQQGIVAPAVVTSPSQHQTTSSGMMIFHDKMTGKNFLVPTGPQTNNEVSELPPLPSAEISDSLISDPKPVLDVSEFLNIPPKPQEQSHLQPQQNFEPISDDEADFESEQKLRFEPISDAEETPAESITSLSKPPTAPSRGKDLQKALQEQIKDMTQSDDPWSESDDDEQNPPEINVSITSQVVPQGSDIYANEDDREEEGEGEDEEGGDSEEQTQEEEASSKIAETIENLQRVRKNEAGNFVVQVEEKQCVVVDGSRRWKCLRCPKMYSSKHNLVTHILGHEGIKPHRCSECGKTFKQPSHLSTHMLTHSTSKAHKCLVCSRTFTQGSHLKRHLAIHMIKKPHHCAICMRGFAYPSELKQHKERVHAITEDGECVGSKKHHACSVCSQAFPSARQLKVHKQANHKDESELTCKFCSRIFVYPSQLKDHVLKHEGNRPYECKDCDMKFMKEHHLRAHAFTHTGIQPFVCPHCQRPFNQKANLQRHLLIHQDEKLFTCRLCKRSFAQAQVLKAHMVVHSDHKPYKCTICHKEFSRQHNLKGHMALHRGGKQYVCFCGASFTLKGNLNRHQKFKHGGRSDGEGTGENMDHQERIGDNMDHQERIGENMDHQEVAHILQGMSHQPVHHEAVSLTNRTDDPYANPTETNTEEVDWTGDLNIDTDIMDEALNSPTVEKRRFLSFEEITAEDSTLPRKSRLKTVPKRVTARKNRRR